MERIVNLYLRGMELENPQKHEDMVLFPITARLNQGPDYLTLAEALEKGLFEVGEVGPGGSVPELKATNNGEKPVLLLDGEELRGAKQNRVLNTTIMIGPKSSVVIPVSCVEARRWHGPSLRMEKSEHMMAHYIRRKKMAQVHRNLEINRSFRSDQSEIWADIDHLAHNLQVESPTGAMSDIYEAREKDLKAYLQAFSCIPEQKGLLVFIEGQPVGLEFVSRDAAFSRLFQKLLKSYVLEAINLKHEKKAGKKSKKNSEAANPVSLEQARVFIDAAGRCEEKRFQSIGLGVSCRYRSDSMVGAALEVDGSVPHLAFFAINNGNEQNRSWRQEENFPQLRIRKRYLFDEE
ncbi:MAG: hypothetical protein N3G18_03225 [Candidatus Saccharicenans sp.]|nr:hypothetical protein [Candidatus Saccharicenans sp.]